MADSNEQHPPFPGERPSGQAEAAATQAIPTPVSPAPTPSGKGPHKGSGSHKGSHHGAKVVGVAVLGGVVGAAALAGTLFATGLVGRGTTVTTGGSSSQSITINPSDDSTTLANAVAAKALPSVVSINVTASDGEGVGSGVVLDTSGNILTNYHVVEGATELAVSTDAGESYEAEIVGTDESSDLAVIRIKDAKDVELTPIEVGDSDDLTVGEWVMAIGSPFGNEQSVSTGIVSALYRSTALPSTSGTSIYANMIQTDAAINPGNSGGALVNDKGELIGINSVIESYSGSSSGVGFAIPVNYAMNIANQIIDGKTPVHPYLGVTMSTVNAIVASRDNLSVSEGARVEKVAKGGPAEKAGIKAGDIITKIGDTEVTSADSLIIAMRTYDVGEKVTLTVVRDKDEKKMDVTLGSDEDLQKEQDAQDSQDAQDNQSDQGDNVEGSGSNSMSEEEFLRYLEELMGQGQGGQGRDGQGESLR